MAGSGGAIDPVQKAAGAVARVNYDGTFHQVIVDGLDQPEGIVANPSTGHRYVSKGTLGQVFEKEGRSDRIAATLLNHPE